MTQGSGNVFTDLGFSASKAQNLRLSNGRLYTVQLCGFYPMAAPKCWQESVTCLMKSLLTQPMSRLKSNKRTTTLNLMDFRLGVPMRVAADGPMKDVN